MSSQLKDIVETSALVHVAPQLLCSYPKIIKSWLSKVYFGTDFNVTLGPSRKWVIAVATVAAPRPETTVVSDSTKDVHDCLC